MRYHLWFARPSRRRTSVSADTLRRGNGRTRHGPTAQKRFRRLLRGVFTRRHSPSLHQSDGSLRSICRVTLPHQRDFCITSALYRAFSILSSLTLPALMNDKANDSRKNHSSHGQNRQKSKCHAASSLICFGCGIPPPEPASPPPPAGRSGSSDLHWSDEPVPPSGAHG